MGRIDSLFLGLFITGYALLHIPFLFAGFGEPDGWRNGIVALHLANGLGYELARFSGFPVIEFTYGMMAKLFPWEQLWIYTNTLTLLLTLVGIFFYFQLVRYHKIPRPLILVLLLFFIPTVFINASSSMDYLWTITFILIAYWALLQRKPIIGGVFLGIAIGVRITNAIFFLPFLIFLIGNPKIFPRNILFRSALMFIFSSLFLSLFCYLPLIIQYSFENVTIFIPQRNFLRSGYYFIQEIFGLLGTIGFIVFLVIKKKGLIQWNWEVSLWSIIIASYLFLFIIKPEKVEYLIPMLPFMGFWIARCFNGRYLSILTFLVISGNLVSFFAIQSLPQGLRIDWLAKGIALQKYSSYRNYIQDSHFLIQYPYLSDAIVVAGWRLPGINYLLEIPSMRVQKAKMLKDRIVFSYTSGKEWRKHTYLVQGSNRGKKGNPSLGNVIIIFPPSTL